MRRRIVDEVMTRDVVTVGPTAGYKEIVEALSRNQVSAVPVVDSDRRVVGVVSEADLLHKVEFAGADPRSAALFERKRVRNGREKAGADTAADLMTSPAVVVGKHESVTAAAKLMDRERVKRLPVIDWDGILVGVVSRGDVLRLFLRPDEDIRHEVRDEVLLRSLWIDPTDITVGVVDGIVTLGGELDRRSAIGVVTHVVASVTGVVDVVSQLTYRVDDTKRGSTVDPQPIIA